MDMMESSITDSADKVLKKQIKRNIIGCRDDVPVLDPIWMTSEIKSEIKIRRGFNRQKRKCQDNVEKERLKEFYTNQKTKVQDLVKCAIKEHETGCQRYTRVKG